MRDSECVEFLQWALPRLARRWPGFRKVRRTVCKRIARRLQALNLSGPPDYREFLEHNAGEWPVLDALLPITISRFYRDQAVFDFLRATVLAQMAHEAYQRGDKMLRAWSIGCASGEEPYTLMLAWRLDIEPLGRNVELRVLATDVDAAVLERARIACYTGGSLKLLPSAWRELAFTRAGDQYCLRPKYRAGLDFTLQDIRHALPPDRFHLILCRNLAFTYFDEGLQRRTLERLLTRLAPGGVLVIGRREQLPAVSGLSVWSADLGIFRKSA
ncbi:MAG: CheR family methyltransferase [Bacteroidota bacterium]